MPLCLFFLCLGVVILEFPWNWVKKERWRDMESLDLLSVPRDFIHPWVCLVLAIPFCCWGLKWFKELQANKEFLVKAGGWVCFLSLFGNVAGEHISIAPFVFLKWVFKWVLHSCGHYNRLKWGNILLSVSQACQLYRFSRSYLSFTPAISSLFSIWIPYLYFDCQYFCRYCHNNCFS